MDKRPYENHMLPMEPDDTDDTDDTVTDAPDTPSKSTGSVKKNPPAETYPCPAGWPPDDWAAMDDANKKAYYWAIENSNKITGGK